jgi:oligopeptide/dipeptide ABC transporter ATP-binding protein
MMEELLRVDNLKVQFPASETFNDKLFSFKKKYVKAVDGVSFTINRGEVVALVGESGCGKSTIGKFLVSLVQPKSGAVYYRGEDMRQKRKMRSLRKNVQYIFQDPFSSLNPRMTVKTILSRPIQIFHLCKTDEEREQRIMTLLSQVGLTHEHGLRFPHEFSGGQKQRISIARALSVEPELIIADEPTAALDISIQAQILKLLINLKETLDLTMLFISHDLGVVEYISDRILVMYLGTIVETGPTKEVINNPLHPYTKALLSAVPQNPLQKKSERFRLSGNIPSTVDIPGGCRLHPRCPLATEACRRCDVKLEEVAPGRKAACIMIQKYK